MHANGFSIENEGDLEVNLSPTFRNKFVIPHDVFKSFRLPTLKALDICNATLGKPSFCRKPLINKKQGKKLKLKRDHEGLTTMEPFNPSFFFESTIIPRNSKMLVQWLGGFLESAPLLPNILLCLETT